VYCHDGGGRVQMIDIEVDYGGPVQARQLWERAVPRSDATRGRTVFGIMGLSNLIMCL
jgi:hypothetical protein